MARHLHDLIAFNSSVYLPPKFIGVMRNTFVDTVEKSWSFDDTGSWEKALNYDLEYLSSILTVYSFLDCLNMTITYYLFCWAAKYVTSHLIRCIFIWFSNIQHTLYYKYTCLCCGLPHWTPCILSCVPAPLEFPPEGHSNSLIYLNSSHGTIKCFFAF